MTRGGLVLAIALLLAAPFEARTDDASGEATVIQDASGRIIVVPVKSPATAPKPVLPVAPASPAARKRAPAREAADACRTHHVLIESWQIVRRRVVAAQEALEAAESIPLVDMGHYRDARIVGAELELEKAEFQESTIETRGHELGVPPRCFDDSELDESVARKSYDE